MLCSLSSPLFFVVDKFSADYFKYEIAPSLKANGRLKFAQDVTFNRLREKGKP